MTPIQIYNSQKKAGSDYLARVHILPRGFKMVNAGANSAARVHFLLRGCILAARVQIGERGCIFADAGSNPKTQIMDRKPLEIKKSPRLVISEAIFLIDYLASQTLYSLIANRTDESLLHSLNRATIVHPYPYPHLYPYSIV